MQVVEWLAEQVWQLAMLTADSPPVHCVPQRDAPPAHVAQLSQPRVLLPRDVFGAIGWRVAHGGGPFAVFSGFVADVGAALGAGVAAATCVGADSTASMARARVLCVWPSEGARTLQVTQLSAR